jgi:VCBS repeat-containing protein
MHRYQTKHKILSLLLVFTLLIMTSVLVFPSPVSAQDKTWSCPDTPIELTQWGYFYLFLDSPLLMVNKLILILDPGPVLGGFDVNLCWSGDHETISFMCFGDTWLVSHPSTWDGSKVEVSFDYPIAKVEMVSLFLDKNTFPPTLLIEQFELVYSPPNQAPVADDDAYSTDEDTTLNIAAPGVLGNDSDADGDPLTAVLDTGPGNGTLTLNADGSFTYTPDSDFNGIDSFIYHANDGSADSNTATVTITVDAVNDPPVANDDAATTDEDTAVTFDVLANDVDMDGDALIVSSITSMASGTAIDNGDGTVTYSPNPNFNGYDSFTYTANDGQANSNVATVTINVIPVNDPPVATDDAYATDEDTTLNIAAPGMLGNDSDPDGDPLTVVVVTVPQHGSGSIGSDGSLNYMPDANFSGSDTFSYKASDGTAESNISTVTITVNPINDPPVAGDDSISVDEGGQIMVEVLSNDTDPDSTLSYANVTVLAGPSRGTAVVNSVGINYTHDGSETTSDTFIYQVEDGAGGSDNATVTVNINPVNDPPVADPNGPYTGTVGSPVAFEGSSSSDSDGTIVSYDWDFGDGAAGSGVSPAHNYAAAGIYTVTLTVIDNDGASHMATTSVDIASIAPEEMIENLVNEIDDMDLPEGIKNSLTASLDTAMKVLNDSNQKNDVAAMNVLKAFIRKVEAQCDKKIPEEVADDLITKAQEIIVVLGLGT